MRHRADASSCAFEVERMGRCSWGTRLFGESDGIWTKGSCGMRVTIRSYFSIGAPWVPVKLSEKVPVSGNDLS